MNRAIQGFTLIELMIAIAAFAVMMVGAINVINQGVTMREGTEDRYVLHGRHENSTIHDEVGMRHYYSEWGKYVDIDPYMLDKVA